MNYEQLAEQIGNIIGIILGITIIIALILYAIYLCIYAFKWTDAKKEYMDKLTKEEKAAINEYLNYKKAFNPLKRSNKE